MAFNDRLARRQFLLRTAAAGALAKTAMLVPHGLRADDDDDGDDPIQRPSDLTAAQAIDAIRSGRLRARRYAKALLARARRFRFLNSLISQDAGQVLRAALEADRAIRRGDDVGPLHGLPILFKDNINTIDLPTSGGTPALTGNVPAANAEIVDKLRDAGAILFGKSNMHELAFGITSNNAAFGPVRNPYNPDLIAGGSSGGNGAALGARIVAASIGTDTGGSTRIPAALCGAVGFRPTLGRYPGTNVEPLTQAVPISHTRDTPGPMARSVEDVALLDAVITDSSLDLPDTDLTGIRLGVARGTFFTLAGTTDGIDPEVSALIEDLLALLQGLGATLVEADVPNLIDLNAAVGFPVAVFEAANIDLPGYLAVNAPGLTFADVVDQIASPDVKFVLETLAPTIPEAAYLDALATRVTLQAAYADYFAVENVDALIFPTTLLPARPIGQDDTVELNGEQVPTFTTYINNTDPAGNAGIPGLSIPLGLTSDGLPVGVEIDGPADSDRDLLSLGRAIEDAIQAAFGALPPPLLPGDDDDDDDD
ncbi:MAG: indoleacetamide hydrolase [Alphaproteobacteria bacterium]|nr:indoleacetamide hydrolase [Alphaproteobacteria bacterium]